MTKVNLPRLLDEDMHEVKRIRPLDGSLFLSAVPLSTATLTLTSEEMISVRDYVELFNAYGSVGIFRVRSQGNVYGAESSTVELEHAICEVGESICNTTLNKSAPLNSAINEIFAFYHGSKWVIGSNTFTDNVVVDISGENVLEAILGLMAQVPEYMLKFDFSVTPWRINVVKKDTIVSAEGRLSRNIQNASITYDDSEMCTRAYVDWDNGSGQTTTVSYDADTIQEYGVIERHLPSSGYTQQQAQIVAQTYLKFHKKPKVAITVSGYDFSDITKETLDRLDVGKLYRLALPKYGVIVDESITGLNWSHLYSNPNDVEISLGDVEDPVVAFVRQVQKSSGGASKAIVKQHKEYWTKFDQTDYYLDLTATRVDNNDNILQQAGMYIDAHGVLQYADDTENQLFSRIHQTADAITVEMAAANSQIYSTISATADELRAEIVAAASGDFGPMYTEIMQTISGLQVEVGYKSRVFVQLTDPIETYPVHDGDFWIVDTLKRKFSDFNSGETFASVSGFRWTDYYGSVIKIRKNGKWYEAANGQMDVLNSTKIEEDREHISLIASTLSETENRYAELKVESSQIRAEVVDAKNDFQSSITQTASQIRSEVSTANSRIYSSITQEASQIRAEVVDNINSVRSSITQTASQIRAEVSDDVNSLRSSITQTASQIRSEVSNDLNSVRSSITQTASQIRSEVRASNSQIYSEIEQNASQIRLKVSYGEVATRLAVECGNVRVSGGDLIVEGMVSASTVQAAIAGISTLNAQNINTAGTVEAVSGDFNQYLAVGGTNLANAFVGVEKTTSGNNITLTFTDANDQEHSVTFSRATSLSGAWGSGKLTVTASPQNEKFERTLQAGNPSWSGGLCTIPINAVWGSSGQYSESTNWNVYASIDKSDIGFTSDGFVQAGQDPHIPSGAIQLSQNLGMPANNYGYYKFHITVNGQRKDYYCSVDTR